MEFALKVWKPFQKQRKLIFTKKFFKKPKKVHELELGIEEEKELSSSLVAVALNEEDEGQPNESKIEPVVENQDTSFLERSQQHGPEVKVTVIGIAEGWVDISNLIIIHFDMGNIQDLQNQGQLSLLNLELNPTTFSFDGPSKVDVDFEFDDESLRNLLSYRILYVRYKVSKPGTYTLHIQHEDKPIQGSPFKILIRGLELEGIQNALKVLVIGDALTKLIEGILAEFKVSTKYSGPGKLNITINGPVTVLISIVRTGRFCYKVTFTPMRPGYYFINIKFNGFHIIGSPFRSECFCTCSPATHAPELPKDDGLTCRRPWVFV